MCASFPYFLLIFSIGILYGYFMEHSSMHIPNFFRIPAFFIPHFHHGFYMEYLYKLESKYSAFLYLYIFSYGEIKES